MLSSKKQRVHFKLGKGHKMQVGVRGSRFQGNLICEWMFIPVRAVEPIGYDDGSYHAKYGHWHLKESGWWSSVLFHRGYKCNYKLSRPEMQRK